MNDKNDLRKSANPYRCCWHCRYYIRPINLPDLLDGPVTEICVIDRLTGGYFPESRMQPGDKDVLPDDVCERFEIDLPPRRRAR